MSGWRQVADNRENVHLHVRKMVNALYFDAVQVLINIVGIYFALQESERLMSTLLWKSISACFGMNSDELGNEHFGQLLACESNAKQCR